MQLLLATFILFVLVTADKDQCYVTQAGCKYKVILQPIDCIVNDDPRSSHSPDVHKHPLTGGEEDVSAAVKRMETLEESLIRMMDGLSTRSLRHIRQIKTDLHQMSKTIEELKASSDEAVERRVLNEGRGKSSNRVRQCPAEFIGGGTWPACYRLAPFNASWHEAKDYCTAIGANLVSLETIKEAYIVDYLIKSNTGFPLEFVGQEPQRLVCMDEIELRGLFEVQHERSV